MPRATPTGAGARRTAVLVPASQMALALSGYVALALGARTLDPADFTSLSSFYLLLNTVGRGIFASVELEGSRALSAARARGHSTRPTLVMMVRRTAILLVLGAALSAVTYPVFSGRQLEYIALLIAGAAAMAVSYFVRGPLAAARRFTPYAVTFGIEAALAAVLAVAFFVGGVTDPALWMGAFVLAPLVAGGVVLLVAARPVSGLGEIAGQVRSLPRDALADASFADVRLSALLWTSLFYLSSQGVWNLAPVLVSARLTEDPSAAAGFVAAAVILRAPVFVFPAVQAVMLPSISAMAQSDDRAGIRRALSPLLLVLLGGAVVWMAAAVFVVPTVARLAFAVPVVPPTPVLASLALSTLFGALAFILQTRLLAYQRHRAVALSWFCGLAALLIVAVVPGDGEVVGSLAQLAGGAVVAGAIALSDRPLRRLTTPQPA